MHDVSFEIDGQTLRGTIFYPKEVKEKNPAILFIHGWMSSEKNYLERAEALTKLGFVCLTFSMRGHGKSDGDIKKQTRQDFLNDVLAAYDFLVGQKNIDSNNINVVGASFGAYLAALVSQKRSVKNLAFRVPANYPDESFNDVQFNFSGDNSAMLLHPKFKALQSEQSYTLKALHNFSGNLLLIESEHDEFIPHQIVENYLNAVKDKSKLSYVIMKDTGHNLSNEKMLQEFIQILTDWFADKI